MLWSLGTRGVCGVVPAPIATEHSSTRRGLRNFQGHSLSVGKPPYQTGNSAPHVLISGRPCSALPHDDELSLRAM